MIKPKHSIFAFLLVLCVILPACQNKTERHIGEWSGAGTGDEGSFTLREDHTATLTLGRHQIGGEVFKFQGKEGVFKYEIDYTKDPIWLDFVVLEKGTNKELLRMKSIIRFISDKRMEWRINLLNPAERFPDFDPKNGNNTLILNKVKD
ncbi:MAG: hypothetical protein U0T82_07685 [Bacteroidales bacterium]